MLPDNAGPQEADGKMLPWPWLAHSRSLGLAVLMWACCAVSHVHAQRFSFHTYNERDGLPSPTVQAVVQDSEGCIWVASRAGVARYDGGEWTPYPVAVGGVGVYGSMHAGPDGQVWLMDSGALGSYRRYDGRQWEDEALLPGDGKRSAVAAALTWANGESFFLVARDGPDSLYLRDEDGWTPMKLGLVVARLAPARDGFLISHSEGLGRLEVPTGEYSSFPGLPPGPVEGALEEPDTGRIWVAGPTWLGIIGPDGFKLLGENPVPGPSGHSLALARDGHGGLFLGNFQALLHHQAGGEVQRMDNKSGHTAGSAGDLTLDRERNLWVASSRGLSKLTSLRFEGMDSKHGLLGDEVSAILRRRSGEMVIGHKYGLTFLGSETSTLRLTDDPIEARVMDLAEGPDGTLWIAASSLGLGRIPPGGELEWVPSSSGELALAMALHLDERGVLWAGGQGGFGIIRDGEFEAHPESKTHGRKMTVRSITSRGDRLLLACRTIGGAELVDGKLVALDSPRAGGFDAFSILCRADGSVWLGTMTGLEVYGASTDAVERLSLNRPVYSLAESQTGAVWLGSDDGMRRWMDEELHHFGTGQGVIGAESNRHALMIHDKERVWFGTDQGLNIYRPEYDTPRPHGPTVEIISARAGTQPIEIGDSVTVATNMNALSFRLRTIAFADEDAVRYRTRLDGLEEEFSEPVSLPTREIRYPHLPPGSYGLHVLAIGPDGQVSPEAVANTITIRAPLSARLWFRAVAATAAVLGLLLLGGFLALSRQAGQLGAAVRNRTAELGVSRAATLAESERLAATLRSIHDAVVVLDPDGVVALWNQAAVETFSISAKHAIGARMDDLFVANLPTSGDFEIVTPDGERRTLELSRAPILGDQPDVAGTVLAFRNITDRLRSEAERRRTQQLEALGILAGGIAHDFNNLLTVLLANLTLAEEELGKSPLISDAVASVWQAESLTRQLLTFSKGGAPVRQTTSLAELVRDSAGFVFHGAASRPVFDISDNLWDADVDVGQIGQVLQNLLLNAREAMPKGGDVTVTAENVSSGPDFLPRGKYVAVHVKDKGPGIPSEHIDRIFDPYFSTKGRGSGLGLTTAYSIVERHGGQLRVTSANGEGSTFSFYLPASRKPKSRAQAAESQRPARPARILVLEDEPGIRKVLRKMLEADGHMVTAVEDGSIVIERYKKAKYTDVPFDVVLMDLTIPGGCGGKETLELLKAFDPEVCAIVVSGYSDDRVLSNPQSYGFAAAIAKPFSRPQVLDTIGRVLRRGGITSRGDLPS